MPANASNYADANSFIYPTDEVKLLDDIRNDFLSAKTDDEFIEKAINFKFDIAKHKNKLYTSMIFSNIHYLFQKRKISAIRNLKINDFINEQENNEKYDAENILKKITACMFLYPVKTDTEFVKLNETTLENNINRRHKIFENIIKNDSSYEPIILVLWHLSEFTPGMNIDEVFKKKIEILESIIEKFKDTEFSNYTLASMGDYYAGKKDFEKAAEIFEKALKYNNFYYGFGDYYSYVYAHMVNLYESKKDVEKVKFFLKLINKNFGGYKNLKRYYSEYFD